MGVIFRVALRNLRQHKAKSVIIGVFICFGVMIVELGNGFLESVNRGLERDFRAHYTGDVVISGPVPDGSRMDMFGVSNMASLGDIKQISAIPDIAATEDVIAAQKGIAEQTKLISAKAVFMKGEEADFSDDNDNASEAPYFFLFAGENETYFTVFGGQHIVEGTYPDKIKNTVLVDVRLRDKFEKYYKRPLNVGDTVLVAGQNTKQILRDAVVCGFYTQPDKDSAMYPLVFSNPSFARAFADLTYGASYAQPIPGSVDTSLSSDSEDDLFGTGSILEPDTDVVAGEGKTNYNSILGDTSLRDKLNESDDGAWNFILLKLDRGVSVKKTITALNSAFTAKHIQSRAMDWEHAAATFTSTVSGISSLFTTLIVILAIVVFIIIMNTLTVSVIERTSEIGTMRALGAEKNFIRKLFFLESVSITMLSAAGGSVLALIVMFIVNSLHLSVSGDMVRMILGGGSISFIPMAGNIFGTIAIVIIGSIFANIYPVSSALRISPLRALSKDGE